MKKGQKYYYASDFGYDNPVDVLGAHRIFSTHAEAEAELERMAERSAAIGEPHMPGQFKIFSFIYNPYEDSYG